MIAAVGVPPQGAFYILDSRETSKQDLTTRIVMNIIFHFLLSLSVSYPLNLTTYKI